MTELKFAPRDTTAACDTLDLTLNCTFDKPWDFYIETNFNARTIGRMGPELRTGITRRNAFRGGEKIDVNLHGSYEWATSQGSSMNNYEYGIDASVEFPRIIAPFYGGNRIRRDKQGRIIRRRRFYSTPSTLAKVSSNVIYRPTRFLPMSSIVPAIIRCMWWQASGPTVGRPPRRAVMSSRPLRSSISS